MSTSDEAIPLLRRAEKWLQRLDDKEYKVLPEFASVKTPDVEGNQFPFSALLSRAMTNYQVNRDFYDELLARVRQGGIISDMAFISTFHPPEELLRQLQTIQRNKQGEEADRAILESFKSHRSQTARNFLYYIDYALSSGFIGVGEALERRIDETEKAKKAVIDERDQLRNQLEQVSEELVSVRALYEDCERRRRIQPAK
jgi:hypothetical protein